MAVNSFQNQNLHMNNKTLLIIMYLCSVPLMADWSEFGDDDGDDTLLTIKALVDQQQYSAAIESLETILDLSLIHI